MSWSNFDSSMRNEGGFMDNTFNAKEGADNKQDLKRADNCVPVLIAQILRYGEKLTVWGNPGKIVNFVAIVRQIESLSTKVSFKFQDDTGIVKGIKWLDGENPKYVPPVKVNKYARIFGFVRNQKPEHYVLILKIKPIHEYNEILVHLMEVTLMCVEGEKLVTEDSSTNQRKMVNNENNVPGLSELQQIVLKIIQDSDSEYGAERDTIKARVPSNMVSKVDEIIEFLSAEGHIYTTKTDNFFKAI